MTCRDCIGRLTESYMALHGFVEHANINGEAMDINGAAMELNRLNNFLQLKKKHCNCGLDDLIDETELTHKRLIFSDIGDVKIGVDSIHGALGRLMQMKAGEI